MSSTSSYLHRYGQQCTILRATPSLTHVSLKRSTKATFSIATRENFFEGIIEASSVMQGGEEFLLDGSTYIAQTIDKDYHSGELAIFCVRTNSTVQIKRKAQIPDGMGNLIEDWFPINVTKTLYPAYIEITTRALKNVDTGLLDTTIYTVQISKLSGVNLMDRMTFDGKNYRVDSIDSIGVEGVIRIQLSIDTRG